MKCIVYLYEHQALRSLIPLLHNENVGVRSVAAYALLPVEEEQCIEVLKEIEKGNYYSQSVNAKYTIKMWKEGEIIFPYQKGFHW
jgi:HEAT repeat protein